MIADQHIDELRWGFFPPARSIEESDSIMDKIKTSEAYAQNLYAAMCNNQFVREDAWEILTENLFSLSWRSSGELVATLRGKGGSYMDFYCSGIQPDTHLENGSRFVREGEVTSEIKEDLRSIGWLVVPYRD